MIYFRVDVSETIGWGHFKRCLALSEGLTHFTSTGFLLPDADPRLSRLIQNSGGELCALPNSLSYKEEISYYPVDVETIIVDLGHRKNLKEPDELLDYLFALKRKNLKIILIDGAEGDQFRHPNMPLIKAVVQPYWSSENNTPPNAEYWIQGEEYILLDKTYKNAYRKRDARSLQNILVTFGGADPQNITETVLTGLAMTKASGQLHNLIIKVIIGPSFSTALISEIENIARKIKDIELIYSPDNLLEYYQWADLCLCGSSTSRYEAGACGLPVIFTAIYSAHEELSRSFSCLGTSRYIGYYNDISAKVWCDAVVLLSQNLCLYKNMILSLEDRQKSNFGTDNLAKEIWEIVKAE